MKVWLTFVGLAFALTNSSVNGQLTYETLWVQYDSAWTFKNLQLIPVRFKTKDAAEPDKINERRFITLREAMEKGKVKIREMQDKRGASVNSLELINVSKEYIWVNSGELLAGGKQDRIIAETMVIGPDKKTNYIDVFCIEKGRWDDKPKLFKNSGGADISLKKIMDVSARQSEVWKEIQQQFSKENKTSDTWPYLTLHRNQLPADSLYLNFFNDRFKKSDSNYAGFIAITGNSIISCELFANSGFTNISFPLILRQFINAAIKGSTPRMTREAIEAFMDNLLINEVSQKKFVAARGKIHYYKNNAIHIVVYGD